MSSSEYLAFIPLLIYGLGLTILLSEWRRIFNLHEIFIPYTLFTLVLTELAVYNVFIYGHVLDKFAEKTYLGYLGLLVSPILFYLAAHVFTPDPGENTKEYFLRRMPMTFSLFALLVGSNFIYDLEESPLFNLVRILFMILLLVAGFTRKIWITYLIVAIWLVTFLFRGSLLSV